MTNPTTSETDGNAAKMKNHTKMENQGQSFQLGGPKAKAVQQIWQQNMTAKQQDLPRQVFIKQALRYKLRQQERTPGGKILKRRKPLENCQKVIHSSQKNQKWKRPIIWVSKQSTLERALPEKGIWSENRFSQTKTLQVATAR